jgi:hypothetical protein
MLKRIFFIFIIYIIIFKQQSYSMESSSQNISLAPSTLSLTFYELDKFVQWVKSNNTEEHKQVTSLVISLNNEDKHPSKRQNVKSLELISIVENLVKLVNITNLNLDLNTSNIDNEGMIYLSKTLPRLDKLTIFNINLSGNNIDNNEAIDFIKTFSQYPKLKTFNIIMLNSTNTPVPDKIIYTLILKLLLKNRQIESPSFSLNKKSYLYINPEVRKLIIKINLFFKYLKKMKHSYSKYFRKEVIWEIIAIIWGSERNDIFDEEVVENIYQFLMS